MYRWPSPTLRMSCSCTVKRQIWVVAGHAKGSCSFTSNLTQAGGATLPCMSAQQMSLSFMRLSMPLAH